MGVSEPQSSLLLRGCRIPHYLSYCAAQIGGKRYEVSGNSTQLDCKVFFNRASMEDDKYSRDEGGCGNSTAQVSTWLHVALFVRWDVSCIGRMLETFAFTMMELYIFTS